MTGFIRLNGVPAVRWTPFASHVRNNAEIERALGSLAAQVCGNEAAATAELRADVRESAAAYVVQIDVPGAAKEDITVDVDEKSLRVEVAFKRDAVEGETQVLSERTNGSATRAFRLPQAVDAEAATARHEHGVLTLTLPKKNVAAQKRLAIN
jgi:HSP20 family protein